MILAGVLAAFGISNLNAGGAGALGTASVEEASANGAKLRVNGADYLALVKPCQGWQKGDLVQILSGSANGKCLTSVMLNLRTKTKCELLCDAR